MASLGDDGDEIQEDVQEEGEDHQVQVPVAEEEDHAAAPQRVASGGDAGDLLRGRGGEAAAAVAAVGGNAGAIAVQSLLYDALTVERYVRDRQWELLQEYLRQFIRRAGHDYRLHHIPMFHCHRGHLMNLMAAGQHSQAMAYFMDQLNGDAMRNFPTQFANGDRIKSEVDMIWESITRGNPIQEPENVAQRINDYMRFHFPRAIGYPWRQGRNLLWRFAFRICMRPSGHATFRCLLCQMVFDKGSIQSKLEKHLDGNNCPGMTEHATNVWREIEFQIKAEKKSALKRPSSSQVISKGHSESIKMPRLQSASTKASKEIAVGDPRPMETGNIGYALLVSLSAVIPQDYADKLEICIGIINESMDEEIRWKEAMNGRSIMLDLLLWTDVTKDQCKELSNYFNSICCSVQQPRPQQPNAPPQEMVPPTGHIDFDNLNLEGLLNCFSYDEEEKIYIEAPPTPYDHIWDYVDQEGDGGLDEPDGNPEDQ
ncbi:hypothetical protein CFC21_031516 [Triticum aestivum]|uniref:BED-type domain-containing protein n=2 Tax=Triticum aestivum TaxID=4565 RepID=A0A9R1EXC1_WHEAT|nr:uncharacterized protein LOC123054446 isoform X2 [Triticum aestivum]KAF7018203.1 hypothetical protein CFC21_031516 [Triticum aestivum]